ncbi:hypothetical protein DY000_02030763 [Brassica cretica]|uniref:Uncharacterized protein n=1 Tax=Brassica cretica TaxID=69181 RepID=A0ABQ7DW61_BRACR|nr:hypothetical protein DY000_02030763 [Brassica cretica]
MVLSLCTVRTHGINANNTDFERKRSVTILGNDQKDEVKEKMDGIHKLLRNQVCLVEDAEAVDTEGDDFWQVVKQEKLQEGDFEVESPMSFGGSHWCRSSPDFEHQSMDFNPDRSKGSLEHRSMKLTKSTSCCNAVNILTHEEFAARRPHRPSPVYVKIGR